MKRNIHLQLSVGLTILMMVVISQSCLGAVHSINSRFSAYGIPDDSTFVSGYNALGIPEFDTRFSVKPDEPYFQASVSWCIDDPLYSFDYYINEQTYVNLNHYIPPVGDSATNLRGSFLTKSGFFIGLDYYTYSSMQDTIISPGYRYSFNDRGYIGFSLDYRDSDITDNGVLGYDLDVEYTSDKLLAAAQIYKPKDADLQIETEINYQLAQNLVAGIILNQYGDQDNYVVGLTYAPAKTVIDFEYGYEEWDHYYRLNGVYSFTDAFGGGIEYQKIEDEEALLIYKFKYVNDKMNLSLLYQPGTDNADEKAYFLYNFTL